MVSTEAIDCFSMDVDSICKRFTKYPGFVIGAYQVLVDQVAKNKSYFFSFVDGEAWGRAQYFVVGVDLKTRLEDSEEARISVIDLGVTIRVYIPIYVSEDIDVAWLTELVASMESVYAGTSSDNRYNIEVFAAVFEAADNIM